MQNLMAQAQKVQKELEKANNEIENAEFEGESGNGAIKVLVKGDMTVSKMEIVDTSILSEKELLEDMIIVAMNDAFTKIAKMKDEKLGKYTGGLGGLF